jgi:cell division septation protein DedD
MIGKSSPRESISTLRTVVANAGVSSSKHSSNSASTTAIDAKARPTPEPHVEEPRPIAARKNLIVLSADELDGLYEFTDEG